MLKLHRERPIPAQGVLDLYQCAGWWPDRTAEQIRLVLDSAPAVGAWDGDRLVGFARVVTDGVFRAYVEDVVVHAEYRGRGVGNALMEHLLDELRGTVLVSLFCKPRLVSFYEQQGFQPTNQVMMHRLKQG